MHAGKLTEVNQDYKEICEAPVVHLIHTLGVRVRSLYCEIRVPYTGPVLSQATPLIHLMVHMILHYQHRLVL